MLDRRHDMEARSRIVELEDRYRSIARKLTIAVAAVGATLVVVSVVLYALYSDIQHQRSAVARDNCEAQNARHDASIKTLDGIFHKVVASAPPAQRRQIEASRAYNVALIDSLTPRRDCEKVARQVTRP